MRRGNGVTLPRSTRNYLLIDISIQLINIYIKFKIQNNYIFKMPKEYFFLVLTLIARIFGCYRGRGQKCAGYVQVKKQRDTVLTPF